MADIDVPATDTVRPLMARPDEAPVRLDAVPLVTLPVMDAPPATPPAEGVADVPGAVGDAPEPPHAAAESRNRTNGSGKVLLSMPGSRARDIPLP